MTELKYDPELPFAFITSANREAARFADYEMALRFGKEVLVGRVIDTTPKPKIPEGAEFITWPEVGGRGIAVWENFNPTKPWDWGGAYYSEESLLEEIGDAEVTVLVRKEES